MNLPRPRRLAALLGLVSASALLSAGCASIFGDGSRERTQSSSVVSYLYPGETTPLPPTAVPILHLPLRVGIAFVPSNSRGTPVNSAISEVQKNTLMKEVAAAFESRDYIDSIQIVPSSYLRAGGGFRNLDQIRNLLGVDVIALLAYDQVQYTSENLLSLTYWTIAGAYIFQGNRNDTETLMEAAVYDIPSRHLLFRAPGISQVDARAAAVYVDQTLRADSSRGFDLATADLIGNLNMQLEDFRERIKQSPADVQIVNRPGYSGAGNSGFVFALCLAGLGLWRSRFGAKAGA